ncbi:hypothetical protein [Microbulbifer variabilis]|uniref:hypothetical protein n=1 Tax=Microbulbifer variabilis TaxID=266805 RepID=UPI00038058D3|nr:hypothetical protein [Microbulbifer variabilis]
MEKLSQEELKQMFCLIRRFADTDLDQFEHWKFDSDKGKVFIELALVPRGSEDAYIEVDHLL